MSEAGLLPIDFAGRRAVVTAGAGGIGRAIAEGFQRCGARVFVCDIDEQALADLASRAPEIAGFWADMSDLPSIERFFDVVDERLGAVDILVNNAGIAGPTAGIADVAPDELRRTLAVDLEAMFHCARRVVGRMRATRSGCIINIGSVASRLSYPMRTPYSAAKWGVVGFTKSLARELGPEGIRVNAILPGHVNTARFDGVVARRAARAGVTAEEMRRCQLEPVAMRDTVETTDIANAALYLGSPFGAAITGQAISVCKGVEMMI